MEYRVLYEDMDWNTHRKKFTNYTDALQYVETKLKDESVRTIIIEKL